ncbi:P-loop containing nucleoside triphosphate hydrolase protein [Polychaeton citri CBS 116435]|uniref:P-loop containing nucleoside triphosphate hydrolase protein n=1 Tax=Polychaeton citri CBS 116435 TaxID=1314669 RepID=A0A9P4QHW9_9PEZI|nr:P-loop containing nucleoside triphosphate hydrolase protein [Polychaeton citri CBS 116435]
MSLSCQDRLPTISASQALQAAQSLRSPAIPSNVSRLDSILSPYGVGFERGKVTEIWGPSGCGKSALCLQASCRSLQDGHDVTWVACAAPLSGSRLDRITHTIEPTSTTNESDLAAPLDRFKHIPAPTLAHLLALILQRETVPPTSNTSFLVIDDLHTLFDIAYPRHPAANMPFQSIAQEQKNWLSGRRYALLSRITRILKKIAMIQNAVVLVTTGCATRMRGEQGLGAALVPGIGGVEWDKGVSARCVVFRDFKGRFIGVQKSQGITFARETGDPGRIVPFTICLETGIMRDGSAQDYVSNRSDPTKVGPLKQGLSPTRLRKRVLEEVADSDEDGAVDEYGWGDGDEDALSAGRLHDGFTRPDVNNLTPGEARENVIEVPDD